jgi:TolB-like protein/Tfp pilus assembly protein PilF
VDILSRIAGWLGENEATISAVVGIAVLAGALFAGLRSLVRRRAETSAEKAPVGAEAPSAADSSAPDLDPLTVPGFKGRPAIAVLPFDDLSSDRDQEYFADGIAEDLITRLSAWREFPVIARNSSFTYKGKPVDVKQVSRELGVRYVVEGSVRKVGDRVRITAQLIDATSGAHIWAEQYDRELRDIFAVQDEIVEEVVRTMRPQLQESELVRAARERPQDPGAYDLVMRGLWYSYRLSKHDNAKARSLFEQALEKDPSYANAWSSLAGTHFLDHVQQWTDSPARSLTELGRTARAGVAADHQSAGCYVALSHLHWRRGEPDDQIAALGRAISLDPSNAGAHGWLGTALSLAGRGDEAITHLEKAMRLDPRYPWKSLWLDSMAWGYFAAGRYEVAVDWAKRSVRVSPDDELGYRTLAASYAQLGRLEDASTPTS